MQRSTKIIRLLNNFKIISNWKRFESTQQLPESSEKIQDTEISTEKALNGNILKTLKYDNKENLSFAKMFKQSKFVALGDLENKYLIGKIIDVVGDDLYIDYGGKFNCVVKKPLKNSINYKRNVNVKIKLMSFEMAAYFLSAAKHITLLESDAELIGIYKTDSNTENDEQNSLLREEIDELNSEPYN